MAAEDQDLFRPFRSAKARDRFLDYYAAAERSWPLESETRSVSTAVGTTFMRISGPEDGEPLVLIPGANSTSLCWAPIVGTLSERYRTYAFDAIYDIGRSVSSLPIRKSEDVTGWLDGVFDELGLSNGVNLMGLSFGGCTAAEYVLRSPRRLARSVWLSPAGLVGQVSRDFMRHVLPCLVPTRATVTGFARWLMPDLAASDQEAFDDLAEGLVLAAKCKGPMTPTLSGLLSDEQLRAVGVPVLYIVGENDRVCEDPRGAVERANAGAPHIETMLVPGAGHEAFALEPTLVGDRVLRFLDE